MSRLTELEARRRVLLARCEVQRLELAQRLASLHREGPQAEDGRVAGVGRAAARHPLAWIAALAGLTVLGRTRDVLALLAFVRTALTVASRAAQLLSFVAAVRARRAARRAES